MTYQTVTVPLLDKSDNAAVLGTALTIARAFQSMIEVVALRQRPIMPAGSFHPYFAPIIETQFAELERAENRVIEHIKAEFSSFCDAAGVKPANEHDGAVPGARFEVVEGQMPDKVASFARISDVSVVRTPAKKGSEHRRV